MVEEGKQLTKCVEESIGNGIDKDEDTCKKLCTDNENCNFVYHNINGLCILWETCSTRKDSRIKGKLFEKTKGSLF